jgi:membrane-associated protein
MDQILGLIRDYGALIYVLLFAYCALKSGSWPLLAGFAAQTGALDLSIVAACVLAGGYLGDEARYLAARRWGEALLRRWPRFRPNVEKCIALLERYGAAYIFLYRYPKGLRTVGAFPVGLTDMPWRRFTMLNMASALTWTLALVGGGYWLGAVLSGWITENWGLASTGLLVLFGTASLLVWRKFSTQPAASPR